MGCGKRQSESTRGYSVLYRRVNRNAGGIFFVFLGGLLADQVIVPLLCRIYPLRKRLPVVGSMRKDEGGAVPIVNVCILCVRRVSCNDPIPFESVCVTIRIS